MGKLKKNVGLSWIGLSLQPEITPSLFVFPHKVVTIKCGDLSSKIGPSSRVLSYSELGMVGESFSPNTFYTQPLCESLKEVCILISCLNVDSS